MEKEQNVAIQKITFKCEVCGEPAVWMTNDPFDIQGFCEKHKHKYNNED